MGLANSAYATSVEAEQERSGRWGVSVFILLLDHTRRRKEDIKHSHAVGSFRLQLVPLLIVVAEFVQHTRQLPGSFTDWLHRLWDRIREDLAEVQGNGAGGIRRFGRVRTKALDGIHQGEQGQVVQGAQLGAQLLTVHLPFVSQIV